MMLMDGIKGEDLQRLQSIQYQPYLSPLFASSLLLMQPGDLFAEQVKQIKVKNFRQFCSSLQH